MKKRECEHGCACAGDLAAAQRKAEVLEGRLRTSEANAAALGDSHATELAQVPCMPTLTYISLFWRRFGHHFGGHG